MKFKVGDYIRIVNAIMPDSIAIKFNGRVGQIELINAYKEYPIRIRFLNGKDIQFASEYQDSGHIYKDEELELISEKEAIVSMI